MNVVASLVIGSIFAGAIYLLLQRTLNRMLLGLVLLVYGAVLLVFTMGGLQRGFVLVRNEEEGVIERVGPGVEDVAAIQPDPLSQAMAITVVIIGLGLLAFVLVLSYRTYQAVGTDDLDTLTTPEQE